MLIFTNNGWVNNEIRKEIRIYLETIAKSSHNRAIHTHTDLFHQARKISNNLTLHLKELEKKNNKQSQDEYNKENNED